MAPFSQLTYLELVAPALPAALFPPGCLPAMRAVAARLPGALSTFFGFECRLGAGQDAVDILYCAKKNELAALAGQRAPAILDEAFWAIPAWQRARQFATLSLAKAGPLAGKIKNMWLEFDLEKPPEAVPVPSLFFGCDTVRSDTDLSWFEQTALPVLYGPLPEAVQARLPGCLAGLPPSVVVFQSGAMLSRNPPFVRLCLHGLTPATLLDYLAAQGWPGDRPALEALLAGISGRVDNVDVDLDVGEQLGPVVGLECSFVPKRSPQDEPRWALFLDWLVESGLCTPAKRAAMLDYSGFYHERTPGVEWPLALQQASRLLGPAYYSSVLWGLHHVKLVLRPDGSLEAKAYLYVSHYWLSASDLRRPAAELSAEAADSFQA